jgi:hypothetical protein
MGCDEGGWFGVAPDNVQCQIFGNTVLSLWISGKPGTPSLAEKNINVFKRFSSSRH